MEERAACGERSEPWKRRSSFVAFLIFKFSYKNLRLPIQFYFGFVFNAFCQCFLFLSHKQQALNSSSLLLPRVSPRGVSPQGATQGSSRQDVGAAPGPVTLREAPTALGFTYPRAGWGQAQPDPHLAASNPLCVGQPPLEQPHTHGWPAMQGGARKPRGSPPPFRVTLFQSTLPCPAACPQGWPIPLL